MQEKSIYRTTADGSQEAAALCIQCTTNDGLKISIDKISIDKKTGLWVVEYDNEGEGAGI